MAIFQSFASVTMTTGPHIKHLMVLHPNSPKAIELQNKKKIGDYTCHRIVIFTENRSLKAIIIMQNLKENQLS